MKELFVNRTKLLAFDSVGGLLAGLLVVACRGPLSSLENLPSRLLLFTGAVNILYGLYSGRLALRSRRGAAVSMLELRALVLGNACWAVFCFVTALSVRADASGFGLAHLIGEGIYVGLLSLVERRVLLVEAR